MRKFENPDRRTVVNVKQLVGQLKKNREKHLKDYEEAVVGYKQEANSKIAAEYNLAKERLDKAYDRICKTLREDFDPSQARDYITFCESIRFELKAPRCYVEVYDQAIEMMIWEKRQTIELTDEEFRCLIMDQWDWAEDFRKTVAFYK